MKEFRPSQIHRSIGLFNDYASDLSSSNYHSWEDRLARFCNYCQTDPVFSNIHEQLNAMAASGFDEWLEGCNQTVRSMVGSGRLVFPLETDLRISYMYELLVRMNTGAIQWQRFVTNFLYPGSSRYDDYLFALNEAVTDVLIRELGYKLEDMEEEIEESNQSQIPASSIQIIHHAESVIQQNASGSNIQQNASIQNNPELEKLFNELREKAQDNNEDLEIISAAEEEASKPNPKKSVVSTLLKGLSCAASSATIITSILELLGG